MANSSEKQGWQVLFIAPAKEHHKMPSFIMLSVFFTEHSMSTCGQGLSSDRLLLSALYRLDGLNREKYALRKLTPEETNC